MILLRSERAANTKRTCTCQWATSHICVKNSPISTDNVTEIDNDNKTCRDWNFFAVQGYSWCTLFSILHSPWCAAALNISPVLLGWLSPCSLPELGIWEKAERNTTMHQGRICWLQRLTESKESGIKLGLNYPDALKWFSLSIPDTPGFFNLYFPVQQLHNSDLTSP